MPPSEHPGSKAPQTTNGSQNEQETRRNTPFSSRAVVVSLLLLVGVIIGALGALQFLVAERLPDLSESTLSAAEDKWRLAGPASYVMDIEIKGARPGTVHIAVRDGEATTMTRDGRTPAERTWHYWTVPGRFSELERELELAEDPVHEMQAGANTRLRLRCEFDSTYGFPRVYHRAVYGGGPEVYWRVTKFEVL